jgi:CDP-diglyceride synthetase
MFSGKLVFGIAVSVVALIGVHEFCKAMSNAGYRPVRLLAYISCLGLFYIALKEYTADFWLFLNKPGGAVVTAQYASQIGADGYAPDAPGCVEAVRAAIERSAK